MPHSLLSLLYLFQMNASIRANAARKSTRVVRIMEMDALPGHPVEPVLHVQGRDQECCPDSAGSLPAVPAAPFAARVAL